MDRRLEQRRLLHRADAHELRPRAGRHGDRDDLARSACSSAWSRIAARWRARSEPAFPCRKKAPAGGAGGRWIRPREGMFACVRIERPMRGIGRFRRIRRSAAAPAGRSPGAGRRARRSHCAAIARISARFQRRSSARSRRSAVGSSQNGSEKASRTSDRVRPISASMRPSRPASALASRRWRRARASCFEPIGHHRQRDGENADQRAAGDRQNGVIARSCQSPCGVSVSTPIGLGLAPQPPESPTRFLGGDGTHVRPLLISETNVFNLTDKKRLMLTMWAERRNNAAPKSLDGTIVVVS